MSAEARKMGRSLVVRLAGELDLHTAIQFREVVESRLDADDSLTSLILNMSRVEFVDSSGLGAILGRYKRISQRGGQVYLVRVQPRVRRIFELSGLFKILSEAASEEEAVRQVGEVAGRGA